MSAARDRTTAGGPKEARARLRTAEAYLRTAELVLEEATTQEFSNVAAGTAVLAGIAASDSICCSRLRKLHRGPDHRGAIQLLGEATPDGKALAAILSALARNFDYVSSTVSTSLKRRGRRACRRACS
jgi:hypothetical protein